MRSEIDFPEASSAVKRGEVFSPSACPFTQSSRSAPPERKTENFRLDEPAFRTRIASAIASLHGAACARAARIRHEGRHRAGGESGDQRVRADGEDDRHL